MRGKVIEISGMAKRACAAFVLLLCSCACYAQSCALCYTQAASSGSRIIHGLRSGILVLIIPPMFMSVGITVLAYRKRNQFNRPDASERSSGGW
jgi:hypothetical protein